MRRPRRRVLLVGGAGRMGRLFARYFRRRGLEVLVCDPAGKLRGFPSAPISEAHAADVVVNAAALSRAGDALDAILAERPRGLVFDIASLKTPVLSGIRRGRRSGVAITSLHPMFGPDVPSFRGRDLLFCDAGDASATRRARALFSGAGLKVRTIPLEAHDAWVAATLGLAHLVALAAGSALAELKLDLADVDGLASTSFRRLLALVESILDQDPDLTRTIQTRNPGSARVAARLAAELSEWREALSREDTTAFRRKVRRTREALKRG